MLESWRDDITRMTYVANEKIEQLQRQINNLMSKLIPDLSINNVSFVAFDTVIKLVRVLLKKKSIILKIKPINNGGFIQA